MHGTKKINNALKIIIKLSVKSVSFKFFFSLLVCDLFYLHCVLVTFNWCGCKRNEDNVIVFGNLQAEMYWFYANLRLLFPLYSTQILHFSYGILGNVSHLYRDVLFNAACIVKHTQGRELAGAGHGKEAGVVSRWLSRYYILVPNSWILCVLYGLIVHQWIPWQSSAIKNQHTRKQKLHYCSWKLQ